MRNSEDVAQCKVHNKPLELFCEDDNESMCSRCAIVCHRQCRSVIEIEQIVERNKLEMVSLKQELLDMETSEKKRLRHIRAIKYKFEADGSTITGKIQTMQDNVNKMFENLKQTVMKEIDAFQKQAFQIYDEKEVSCESVIAETNQIAFDMHGSQSEDILMFNQLKKKVEQLRTRLQQEQDEEKVIVLTFDFDSDIKLPPSENHMPGKLTIEYANSVETSTESKLEENQTIRLKLITSVDVKQGDGNLEEPLYSGMDFLPDGRLVAVDNMNNKCVVMNQELQKLGSYSLQEKPLKVVAFSDEEVAVTSWDIIFLRVNKSNEISFVRTCPLTRIYDSICMIDEENFLVGTVDDPEPVRVISLTGEEKEINVNLPKTTYPADHSACTYIKNCGKVVMSDRYAHTIYICDVGSRKRVEVKDENFIKEPCGLASGPADCVFVCSDQTNSVVLISHTGEILESIELDVEFPRSICISKDHCKLAVCNACIGEIKLQLFEIEWT